MSTVWAMSELPSVLPQAVCGRAGQGRAGEVGGEAVTKGFLTHTHPTPGRDLRTRAGLGEVAVVASTPTLSAHCYLRPRQAELILPASFPSSPAWLGSPSLPPVPTPTVSIRLPSLT